MIHVDYFDTTAVFEMKDLKLEFHLNFSFFFSISIMNINY